MNRQQRRAAERAKKKTGTGLQQPGASSHDAEQLFNAAFAAFRANRIDQAVADFGKFLDSFPHHPKSLTARVNLIAMTRRINRIADSYLWAKSAIDRAPFHPVTYLNLGMTLLTQGNLAKALQTFCVHLALDPKEAKTWDNLGIIYERRGENEKAAYAFRKALINDPQYFEALINLGNCQRRLSQVDEAAFSFHKALLIKPAHARGLSSLAAALWDIGRLEDALPYYQRALAVDPQAANFRSMYLFALCFSDLPPEKVFAEHRRYGEIHERRQKPFCKPLVATGDTADRPVRVGYLSANLTWHPGGHFLSPHLFHHNADATEVFCYHTGGKEDQVTRLIRGNVRNWRELRQHDDRLMENQIRADKIDILVDCMGHLAENRLTMFARRAAPIQMSFPLYPSTTGLKTMDYRLGDPYFTPPRTLQYHTESMVILPHTHVCYAPVQAGIDPLSVAPFRQDGRFTFGCFNHIAKVNDLTIKTWASILKAVPRAKLVLKWRGLNGSIGYRLTKRFEEYGARADQIHFEGWSPNPYAPYRSLDLCLDPLGKNGGTTTCDSLWMGVPVLTCVGDQPFSRVGLCHLTALGMPNMITKSPEDYIAKAVHLAENTDVLEGLRNGLRDTAFNSNLMNSKRYAAELDCAYRFMMNRHRLGLAPTTFVVPEGGFGDPRVHH